MICVCVCVCEVICVGVYYYCPLGELVQVGRQVHGGALASGWPPSFVQQDLANRSQGTSPRQQKDGTGGGKNRSIILQGAPTLLAPGQAHHRG